MKQRRLNYFLFPILIALFITLSGCTTRVEKETHTTSDITYTDNDTLSQNWVSASRYPNFQKKSVVISTGVRDKGLHYYKWLLDGFVTVASLEKMSGYPLYRSGKAPDDVDLTSYGSFEKYNIVFLRWCRSRINSVLGNAVVRKLTRSYFEDFYQENLETYRNVYTLMTVKHEVQKNPTGRVYWGSGQSLIGMYDYYVERNLSNRFYIPDHMTYIVNNDTKRRSIFMFWVRRISDGTAKEIDGIISDILESYRIGLID